MGEISYLNVLSERTYPELTLCKPDRTTIHHLKDIYGLKLIIRAGAINEINFTIPTTVTRKHETIMNPLIDLIKDRYYTKMSFEGQTEYFLFLDRNKQLSSDGTTASYTAYGCGIELADKDVYEYNEESKTLSQHANELLSETIWKLDFVNTKFDLKYRSFEASSSNVSEALFNLAEKYNALIVFDTVNRKINFHEPNNIGMNRGLQLREGYLLDSLSVSTKAEDMVTRLKVYGQDGLEFRSLSPTGSNYIEDFSYFIYPFECDENYNVFKHSDYMNDDLCIAILKYKKKLLANQGTFDNLVSQRKDKQNEIQQAQQVLSTFNTEIKVMEDEQWVINRQHQDAAPSRSDWISVTNRINAKNLEILNQENLIDTLDSQLESMAMEIYNLGLILKTENNFTESELVELNKYILVSDYSNESIVDEQDLWEEGQEVFETFNEPPINATIGLEGYVDSIRDKLKPKRISIGDISNIESEELRVKLKLKTIEINIDFDNDKVELTIANGKDVVDEDGKLKKFITNASSTSTTVNMDKYKWNKGKDAMDGVTQILNSEFDTAKNVLIGGYQNTTEISTRGLYSQDYDDENTYLVINNGLLALTTTNGNSVEVSISKRGVHAEKLVGRVILSNKLVVEDTSGVITIEDAKMTVFDLDDKARVEVGRYVDPADSSKFKYGLYVKDGAIDLRTSSNQNRGTQFDSNGIRAFNNNGVRTFNVNAATGQVEIIGDLTIKSSTASNKGVAITSEGIKGYDSTGNITFELNANSGLTTIQDNLLIQTSKYPNLGVKMDNDGIRGYDLENKLTFNLRTGDGSAYFKGAINASVITGSTINGGTINVEADTRIGRNLYLGSTFNNSFNRGIYFGGELGYGRLTMDAYGSMTIYGETSLNLNSFNNITFKTEDGGLIIYRYDRYQRRYIEDYVAHTNRKNAGFYWNGLDRVYYRVDGLDMGWVTLTTA